MPIQSWNVDFDGPSRQITAEIDPQSGRVAIRVDGRMAGKPLSADEQERTFNVGSVTYVIRRNGHELDLDIAPVQSQPVPQASPAQVSQRRPYVAPEKQSLPLFRIVFGIVLTVVLGIGARWGQRYFAYMNVPWQSYTHSDRMFRVKFAGAPEKSSNTFGELRTMQLKSSYKGHFYIVEFVEFPDVIPLQEQGKITNEAFDEIVKDEKWTLLERKWGNQGLNFIAEVPKSKDWSIGTARGTLIPIAIASISSTRSSLAVSPSAGMSASISGPSSWPSRLQIPTGRSR